MTSRGPIFALVALIFGAGIAAAGAPLTSPRPVPRPALAGQNTAGPASGLEGVLAALAQPKPRPVPVVQVALSASGPALSPRPVARPDNLRRLTTVAATGFAQATAPARALSRGGSVCGVLEIRGEALAPIPGKIAGCGVEAPVRVTEVAGVKLTRPATLDCDTAKALNVWVRHGVQPAVGRLGGGVAELKVIAHYACRTRNSRAGARISEHGKGRAVDVAGVILKNGVALDVLKGWRGQHAKVLRAMHESACGPFGTVLGPNSDRYHQDHIHVDTARYRSGPYCR